MQKIIILSTFLILISSCTIWNSSTQNKGAITNNDTLTQWTQESYETDLDKVWSRVKDSEEFKKCMDVNVPMCIQNAGTQLAQKEKNADICNELITQDQKDSCVFVVTLVNAQEKKDINTCNTLSWIYKDQCTINMIRSEAMEKKDINICKMLEKNQKSEINTLYSLVDECMMNVVMMDSTIWESSCTSISSPAMKEMCKTTIENRKKTQKDQTNQKK